MKALGKEVATIEAGRCGPDYTITFYFTDGTESFFAGTAEDCLRQLAIVHDETRTQADGKPSCSR